MASQPRAASRTSGTATPIATHGSQTILETHTSSGPSAPSATLRLRAADHDAAPRVRWAEEVVDNEGLGRKSSKVCCIYHKPHQPGDSESDSSDSSSSSGSDSEPDLSRAQKAGGKGKGRGRKHEHGHGDEGGGKGKGNARRASPNAYERQPKYKSKKES